MKDATPAEEALRECLKDQSGAVQIAAAEALARLGKPEIALPVLEHWITQTDNMAFSLQAGNVLDRLGEEARPSLAVIKEILINLRHVAGIESMGENNTHPILNHSVSSFTRSLS